MANNRLIPRLADLAFGVLFAKAQSTDGEITPTSVESETVLKQYSNIKHGASSFFQAIANANLHSAQGFLENNSRAQHNLHLLLQSIDTVTSCSGYTYEHVTAIQLAFLMNDVEMCNMMLPYIKKQSAYCIKQTNEQLAAKMAEVEEQQKKFQHYNFSQIAATIKNDEQLNSLGTPNSVTEKMLAEVKKDLQPSIIRIGKSMICSYLVNAYAAFCKNWYTWTLNQNQYFLISVIGYLQTLVEKSFEQECSQGLGNILKGAKPKRDSQIKNQIKVDKIEVDKELYLTYQGIIDDLDHNFDPIFSLTLGKDLWVEICQGESHSKGLETLGGKETIYSAIIAIIDIEHQKKAGMEEFKRQLSELLEPQSQIAHKF